MKIRIALVLIVLLTLTLFGCGSAPAQSTPTGAPIQETQPGDIVLYSGDQIVIFYGPYSWAYTRLGRITDQNAEGMAALLSDGNVTITIAY